jgi:hypothetical protein
MPAKLRIPKARYGRLSHAQEQMLRYGPIDEADDEARELWQHHRARLMATYNFGTRPAAWWCFEHPELCCDFDQQGSTLYEASLLLPGEKAALVAWWRGEFEKILDLEGTDAQAAHLRWADIPFSLFRKWGAVYAKKKPRGDLLQYRSSCP